MSMDEHGLTRTDTDKTKGLNMKQIVRRETKNTGLAAPEKSPMTGQVPLAENGCECMLPVLLREQALLTNDLAQGVSELRSRLEGVSISKSEPQDNLQEPEQNLPEILARLRDHNRQMRGIADLVRGILRDLEV